METVERKGTIISGSMIGTIIEWYGIFLFSSGAIFMAYAFLPKGNIYATIASTFLLFAIGFFMRPVGAIVFGHYGDKIGRKNVLIITLLISGLATGFVGVLPTYQEVGIWAIILLVILRLILGFGLGGEWGGAMLLTIEHFSQKRGFWSAFIQSTVGIGMLLGAAAFLVLEAIMPSSALYSWGWRVPYLLTFLMIVIGLFIRFRIPETPIFEAAKKENQIVKYPVVELFKNHWRSFILGLFIAGSAGTFFYVAASLLPTLFEILKVIPLQIGLVGVSVFAIADIIFCFIGGYISDRVGRRALIILANIFVLIIIFPSFYFKSVLFFILFLALYGFAHGINYAPLGSLISEIYPTNVRYTGNSITYQFANAYIAGPASFVSSALGIISYVLYPVYGFILAIFGLISGIIVKETKDLSLTGGGISVPETVKK